MPGKNVAEEMYDFQRKYGFLEKFEDLEAKGRATANPFKYVDSFLSSNEISFENRQYLHGLTYMLNKYVNDNTEPTNSSKAVYSVGNLNVMDFVNEYESIIQKRHETKNPNTPRKPFNGIEIEVLKAAERFSKNLSRPLVDIWADKIKAGTYSLSQLREITSDVYSSSSRGRVKTAAIIHKAMEKIADERSLGERLNPLNWPRMFREYRYRNEVYSRLEKNKGTFLSIHEELSDARRDPLLDPKMAEDIEKLREAKEAEFKIQQEKAHQAKLETEVATKEKFTVNEAANEQVKTNDVKQPSNDVPTKDRNNTLNLG